MQSKLLLDLGLSPMQRGAQADGALCSNAGKRAKKVASRRLKFGMGPDSTS